MTGTFAGQYVMIGFLDLHWDPWMRILVTRLLALGPCLILVVIAETDVDSVNEWLNVQQSIQLPFALLPLLFFSSNERVMGDFIISNKMQIFYWIVSLAIIAINVYLTIDFMASISTIDNGLKWFLIVLFLIIYLGFIAYLMIDFLISNYNLHFNGNGIIQGGNFFKRKIIGSNNSNSKTNKNELKAIAEIEFSASD